MPAQAGIHALLTFSDMVRMTPTETILRAAPLTADNAEAGFARIREITASTLDDAALAQAVSDCVAQKLIHDPIRLPEGALHCHWTLELTAAGVAAAWKLIPENVSFFLIDRYSER